MARVGESCANTFDPTVAPGLDRPIGSFLSRRNGLQAWYKFGAAATDWTTLPGGFASSAAYSLDEVIKMRASSLLGLTQLSYWSDPFTTVPARPGTTWTPINGPGIRTNNQSAGGIVQLGGADYRGMIVDPYYLAPYPGEPVGEAPSFVGEISHNNPFYFFVRFRLQASQLWSADCSMILGLVDATTLAVAGAGIGLGRNFFGGVGGNVNALGNLTGVDGVIAQNFAWHSAEVLRLANGIWWVKYDDGAWLNFSSVVSGSMRFGTPFVQIMTTLATSPVLPVVEIDHFAIATRGNAANLATQPTPP